MTLKDELIKINRRLGKIEKTQVTIIEKQEKHEEIVTVGIGAYKALIIGSKIGGACLIIWGVIMGIANGVQIWAAKYLSL